MSPRQVTSDLDIGGVVPQVTSRDMFRHRSHVLTVLGDHHRQDKLEMGKYDIDLALILSASVLLSFCVYKRQTESK